MEQKAWGFEKVTGLLHFILNATKTGTHCVAKEHHNPKDELPQKRVTKWAIYKTGRWHVHFVVS